MNETINTILNRKSIRKFAFEPVPEEDLHLILKAGQWAPSGSNQQPWRFLIIRNIATILDLADLIMENFEIMVGEIKEESSRNQLENYRKYLDVIRSAPLVICVLAKPYESFLKKYAESHQTQKKWNMVDVYPATLSIGAAIENMLLAAHSLGYGSCWMTGPLIFQSEIEKFLQVEQPYHIVSMVPFGKSISNKPEQRYRLPLKDICTFWD